MAIYARQPRRRLAQVSADLFVLAWGVGWWLLSRLAARVVLGVAAPARQTASTAGRISAQFRDASGQVAQLPGVGTQLRRPFDSAAGSFSDLVATADQQVASIERLAHLLGWLVFLVPVALLLAFWLPRRLGYVVASRAGQRYVDSGADLDLFALRSLVMQPTHVLADISLDPARAWRQGDATVISKLADVELRRNGLRMPPPVIHRGRHFTGAGRG